MSQTAFEHQEELLRHQVAIVLPILRQLDQPRSLDDLASDALRKLMKSLLAQQDVDVNVVYCLVVQYLNALDELLVTEVGHLHFADSLEIVVE